jgi:DNA replication protein DnaC
MDDAYIARLRVNHPALCPACIEKRRMAREAQVAAMKEAEKAAEKKAREARIEREQEVKAEQEKAARLRAQEDAERHKTERTKAIAFLTANIETVLLNCGVPLNWKSAHMDGCSDLPADLVAKAKAWVENPRGFLYLTGATGSGKTYLAASIIRHGLEMGILLDESLLNNIPMATPGRSQDGYLLDALCHDCLFISERDYLADLKQGYDEDRSIGPLAGKAQGARFLVLDDLAASRLTDWGRGEMAGLIEGRHASQLATVITSNLTLDELTQAIDARVSSRIAESRQVWTFPARDLRQK